LHGRLQASVPRYPDKPALLLADLNRQMLNSTQGHQYATLFFAVFDRRDSSLTYSNAGHLPPLLLHPHSSIYVDRQSHSPFSVDDKFPQANFEVTRLAEGGMVLGLLPGQDYKFGRARLTPGDILLLFSDGALEASIEADEFFGEERLLHLAIQHSHESPLMLRDAILNGITNFCGAQALADDLTLVVVKASEAS
jgi:sigma-B regulation protein RsbU (phosphoserine phosphatase)